MARLTTQKVAESITGDSKLIVRAKVTNVLGGRITFTAAARAMGGGQLLLYVWKQCISQSYSML